MPFVPEELRAWTAWRLSRPGKDAATDRNLEAAFVAGYQAGKATALNDAATEVRSRRPFADRDVA